jgi:hypothetical protein
MTVGGDVAVATPLANVEAPFVWLAFVSACVFFSWLPLLAVFQNNTRRAQWIARHNGTLPWLASSGFATAVYITLSVVYILSAAISYWISRGGHEFKNRIVVETSFYVAQGCVAAWSWIAAFMHWHSVPALVLAVACGAEISFITFAFVALPLYAGGIGLLAGVALLGTFVAWVIVVQMTGERTASVAGFPLPRSDVMTHAEKAWNSRL